MLVNLDGQSCYTDHGVVHDPGVNGWYGTGQAYTGIEGTVGVKGKYSEKKSTSKLLNSWPP